ncbi:MAG TPA: SDR family oxidoreductase, partial [Polyangia bacterium]|nr:SDR family oxidoreductase [Polyangia bacterium]
YQPKPPILDYASTKGAIVTFTKGLAQELAERGIRVNSVAPGPVWTPLIVQSFPAEKVKTFGKNNPMGRPAQPAELAPAYVFLACDDSRFMTGEVVGLTGGEVLG